MLAKMAFFIFFQNRASLQYQHVLMLFFKSAEFLISKLSCSIFMRFGPKPSISNSSASAIGIFFSSCSKSGNLPILTIILFFSTRASLLQYRVIRLNFRLPLAYLLHSEVIR